MIKFDSERGSVTVFVIVAFIFCMTILVGLYWTSSNHQVTVLQSEQRIKDIYGRDVDNVNEIYQRMQNNSIVTDNSTIVL